MRCTCCDKNLSDKESTTKYSSGEYADLCTPCRKTIEAEGVAFIVRGDLQDDETEPEHGYEDEDNLQKDSE